MSTGSWSTEAAVSEVGAARTVDEEVLTPPGADRFLGVVKLLLLLLLLLPSSAILNDDEDVSENEEADDLVWRSNVVSGAGGMWSFG